MRIRLLTLALFAGALPLTAFAASQSLLPPQAGDLVPTLVHARIASPAATVSSRLSPAAPQVHEERQPIQVSWALNPADPLDAAPQPVRRESREYWREVSDTELQRGVELSTTAPGAIIRLSPGQGSARIQAADMRLQIGGKQFDGRTATRHVADAAQLQAAGMDATDASLALQLRPDLGAGRTTLQAATARGRYVVYVYEPQSPLVVEAQADRPELLLGGSLQVSVNLRDGAQPRALGEATGVLRSPDGETTPLRYRRQAGGGFVAIASPAKQAAVPGLWEAQSIVTGTDASGREVRRNVTTTFAVAVPDARFVGTAEPRRATDGGIDIAFSVDVQSGSRYAVSGVLYGRNAEGAVLPAAYAQSAAWLEAGNGELHLRFDPASLRGLAPPYELHDLRLQDQPAMGLVERRATALRFSL
ncbi:DUF4785 family protein [Dyella sp. BiH032]|uniref:DUF4785 domain-containing protein n=1 Tax=Dyella sp. BiH032 TaxID=3075430 RepID=UPI002892BABB|nr:DUF4785 domain-containing protein [Dyella sp. BiH032]WNL47523.1 DUF4785 family protein [Dyella sp. BiH032]